ncbi:MAG: cytochrome c, partial [Betaproteobacteria bacterium]|nr:cytochrome c [Betaproteobacteria bacterium]
MLPWRPCEQETTSGTWGLALTAALIAVWIGRIDAPITAPAIAQDAVKADTPAPAAPTAPVPASNEAPEHPEFYAADAGLSDSERAGREIWYKATAGNARFHTYTFQQRVGVLIDWYRVLNAAERADRFKAWGIINDPGCCTPGSEGCPAKSLEETYGFEYCPGDAQLLQHVGKPGYRDPACDFRDAKRATYDIHSKSGDQRQSACDLAFGTSTGALGFRKFPNPRFDAERWRKLNGSLASWEGYRGKLSVDARNSDSALSRLSDGSIEPPFLIGTSCGSCHVAFDPLNPPANPANPKWSNLKATIGNQYIRISELLGSGMAHS